MEKDSHYYVIYFMCLTAGIAVEDAYEIAYSSQYVDDSKDGHKKVLINKKNSEKACFDPIRTSHNGFESIGVEVQEKIYYPFHFLPGLKGESFEKKMITCSGEESVLFKSIIDEGLKNSNPFRFGIGLHVLADTYSHANFSGLWAWSNDVSRVNYIPAKKGWFSNLFGKIFWNIKRCLFAAAPPIGHSNAYTFPDIPYLNWKYFDYIGKLRSVSNNMKFIKGFLTLYKLFIKKYAERQKKSSRLESIFERENEELRQRLWEGINFSGSLKKRCENWRDIIRNFVADFNQRLDDKIKNTKDRSKKDELERQKISIPERHLLYNEKDWEKDVLKKKRKFFLFDSPERKLKVSLNEFKQSPFYRFHEAARGHRVFVLEKISEYYLGIPVTAAVKAKAAVPASDIMISSEIIKKTRQKNLLKEI
jgi:hypothetical protein